MRVQSTAIAKEGKLQNTQTQELRKRIETQTVKNSTETNAIMQIIQASCIKSCNIKIVHLAHNHHVLTVTYKSSILYLTIMKQYLHRTKCLQYNCNVSIITNCEHTA